MLTNGFSLICCIQNTEMSYPNKICLLLENTKLTSYIPQQILTTIIENLSMTMTLTMQVELKRMYTFFMEMRYNQASNVVSLVPNQSKDGQSGRRNKQQKWLSQEFTSGGRQHLTVCHWFYYNYDVGHKVVVPYRETRYALVDMDGEYNKKSIGYWSLGLTFNICFIRHINLPSSYYTF